MFDTFNYNILEMINKADNEKMNKAENEKMDKAENEIIKNIIAYIIKYCLINNNNDIILKCCFDLNNNKPIINELTYNINLPNEKIYNFITNHSNCQSIHYINNKKILCKINECNKDLNTYYLHILIINKLNSKL